MEERATGWFLSLIRGLVNSRSTGFITFSLFAARIHHVGLAVIKEREESNRQSILLFPAGTNRGLGKRMFREAYWRLLKKGKKITEPPLASLLFPIRG